MPTSVELLRAWNYERGTCESAFATDILTRGGGGMDDLKPNR